MSYIRNHADLEALHGADAITKEIIGTDYPIAEFKERLESQIPFDKSSSAESFINY